MPSLTSDDVSGESIRFSCRKLLEALRFGESADARTTFRPDNWRTHNPDFRPHHGAHRHIGDQRSGPLVLDPSPWWITFARLVASQGDQRDKENRNGKRDNDPHVEDQQGSHERSDEHGSDGDETSA